MKYIDIKHNPNSAEFASAKALPRYLGSACFMLSELIEDLRVAPNEKGLDIEIVNDLVPHARDKKSFKIAIDEEGSRMASGVLLSSVDNILSQRRLTVDYLVVNPEQRGRGIGSEIMGQAETLAEEAHCHQIGLLAVNNTIRFYEQLGFRVVFSEKFDNGMARMEKNI